MLVGVVLKKLRRLAPVALLAACACTAAQKASARNYLTDIVGRVDLGRVLQCATPLVDGIADADYRQIGTCLAGYSIDFVGDELRRAIDQAVDVAQAKTGGAQHRLLGPAVSEEQALAELHLQLGLAIEGS